MTTSLHDLLADLPGARRGRRGGRARASGRDPAAERCAGLARRVRGLGGGLAAHRPAPVRRPVGLIFAADHGVAAAEPVSAYPTEVTAAMFAAYQQGRRRSMCSPAWPAPRSTAVDVGIGRPTNDIRVDAALRPRAVRCGRGRRRRGRRRSRRRPVGAGRDGHRQHHPVRCDRRRARRRRDRGLGRSGHRRRRRGPRPQAGRGADRRCDRIAGVTDPIEVLREVGGAELVAIAAATIAARHRSLPVVLDGYVVTASVLPLVMANPAALDHCTRRPLLGRAGTSTSARTAGQATAARSRHAARRGPARWRPSR